ncbi:hypothetical protein FB446DRAFT_77298 [Lentinula raphanica]|nr:hypothetical protein FB446DRAFT_77298 [Lentinula raphanica]
MHFLTTLPPLITLAVRVAAMDTRRLSVETLPVYTRPPSYCTTGPASAAASIDLDVEPASGRTSSHGSLSSVPPAHLPAERIHDLQPGPGPAYELVAYNTDVHIRDQPSRLSLAHASR